MRGCHEQDEERKVHVHVCNNIGDYISLVGDGDKMTMVDCLVSVCGTMPTQATGDRRQATGDKRQAIPEDTHIGTLQAQMQAVNAIPLQWWWWWWWWWCGGDGPSPP